jgi:hypothetical protein
MASSGAALLYFIQPGRKFGAKDHKILLFTDQCSAHPKNTNIFQEHQNYISPTIPASSNLYRVGYHPSIQAPLQKAITWKAVAMTDGGRLQATRNYMHMFVTGDNINAMCKKAENKLYRLTAKEDNIGNV